MRRKFSPERFPKLRPAAAPRKSFKSRSMWDIACGYVGRMWKRSGGNVMRWIGPVGLLFLMACGGGDSTGPSTSLSGVYVLNGSWDDASTFTFGGTLTLAQTGDTTLAGSAVITYSTGTGTTTTDPTPIQFPHLTSAGAFTFVLLPSDGSRWDMSGALDVGGKLGGRFSYNVQLDGSWSGAKAQ